MSLYSVNYVSDKLSREGIWVDINCGDDCPPARFKMACKNASVNLVFAVALEQMLKENKRKIDQGTLTRKQDRMLMLKIFCKHILLDWENVTDKSGKKIPFNEENAIQVMSDLPVVYDYLRECSEDTSLFQHEEEEEKLGNSKGS